MNQIKTKLAGVTDPGTSLDIMEMGLVKNLAIDESTGKASLTFAPSSPVCPMAFKLAADIKNAVEGVEGVVEVEVSVENYNRASELEGILNLKS